jgi:hypothetical protein
MSAQQNRTINQFNSTFNEQFVRQSSDDLIASLCNQTITARTRSPDLLMDDNDPSSLQADCEDDDIINENPDSGTQEEHDHAIPFWNNLQLDEIYDKINPTTKIGINEQRVWRKKAVDVNGKAITSVGIVANRLLKLLIKRGLLSDTVMNLKLQTRKQLRDMQKEEFSNIGLLEDDDGQQAVIFIKKFLSENFLLPTNADGEIVDVNNIGVNLGARIIMLAVEPESFMSLQDIFAAPDKAARRAQIDNKNLSFNEKWNAIANNFFNAKDFEPTNEWSDKDTRIIDIDPRLPPITPWSGEELRKYFRTLKTKFALIDDVFCRSGNLEAGVDIEEADRFDGHIKRILNNESNNMHMILLFAFWAFDKKPPKFVSRAKPEHSQFDSSEPTNRQLQYNNKERKHERPITLSTLKFSTSSFNKHS